MVGTEDWSMPREFLLEQLGSGAAVTRACKASPASLFEAIRSKLRQPSPTPSLGQPKPDLGQPKPSQRSQPGSLSAVSQKSEPAASAPARKRGALHHQET